MLRLADHISVMAIKCSFIPHVPSCPSNSKWTLQRAFWCSELLPPFSTRNVSFLNIDLLTTTNKRLPQYVTLTHKVTDSSTCLLTLSLYIDRRVSAICHIFITIHTRVSTVGAGTPPLFVFYDHQRRIFHIRIWLHSFGLSIIVDLLVQQCQLQPAICRKASFSCMIYRRDFYKQDRSFIQNKTM